MKLERSILRTGKLGRRIQLSKKKLTKKKAAKKKVAKRTSGPILLENECSLRFHVRDGWAYLQGHVVDSKAEGGSHLEEVKLFRIKKGGKLQDMVELAVGSMLGDNIEPTDFGSWSEPDEVIAKAEDEKKPAAWAE